MPCDILHLCSAAQMQSANRVGDAVPAGLGLVIWLGKALGGAGAF